MRSPIEITHHAVDVESDGCVISSSNLSQPHAVARRLERVSHCRPLGTALYRLPRSFPKVNIIVTSALDIHFLPSLPSRRATTSASLSPAHRPLSVFSLPRLDAPVIPRTPCAPLQPAHAKIAQMTSHPGSPPIGILPLRHRGRPHPTPNISPPFGTRAYPPEPGTCFLGRLL